MNKKLMIIGAALLIAMTAVFAGDTGRTGTTSGVQLLIPVGARSIALGGASFADVTGAEAIYWNPAGMSQSHKSEALFNNMQYIADIDVNYLALTFNGGPIGAFGFHLKSLDFGDIEQTTEDEPEGNGILFSPNFIVAGFTYSRPLTDRISAGLTGKLIHEGFLEANANAFAFDLGVQYAFGNGLRVGVVMKNVGSKLQYSGRGLDRTFKLPSTNINTDDAAFRGIALASDIPSVFSFGLTYKVNLNEENNFSLTGAFSNLNDASDQIFGGVEYGFRDLFFLRGGYNYESQVNSDDRIFGASFGAGLKYPLGNFDFSFDYAWRQLTNYFDSNNIFTIKLGF